MGVGSFTIKVPVPFARSRPVSAKVKVYSTSTAFAGSELAATNNAMTRTLGTFSMCMEKSLQVFRRPGWPNLVKSNAPKDESGGARGCTKDGMAKLANQMENRRKARTCRELKTAA
jgi:hypothetical protein